MLFNSHLFVFVFLPIVVALFNLKAMRPWRHQLLVVASIVFYGYSGTVHAAALAIDVILVWYLMKDPDAPWPRFRFILAVTAPLMQLIFFKYRGFIAANLGFESQQLSQEFVLFNDLILPAGISFFTFQLVSYAVDRHAGRIKEIPSLLDLMLYISFFPQLVAGPILRYEDVKNPIRRLRDFTLTQVDLVPAISYLVWGLAFKVLLADGLGFYVDDLVVNNGQLGLVATAYVVLGFSFQIYFDFYGYSLIAIGLGRLFGFRFPRNFLRPYESTNPKEFWRRWHVTLSFWLRDYLYIRIGGNRNYIRNILVVFAVCGLWHGAGWNFVVWGVFHAFLVVGYTLTRNWWDRMPILAQRALTFGLVSIGWTLFLFDFNAAYLFLVSAGNGAVEVDSALAFIILGVAALACFGLYPERMAEREHVRPQVARIYTIALALVLTFSLLWISAPRDFIYFRF